MRMQAFSPTGNAVTLTVTASSGNTQVNAGAIGQPSQIRIANIGSLTSYVAFGSDNTVTANTTTSMALLPNSVGIFTIGTPTGANVFVAAIASTTGNSLNLQPGEGI